MRTAHEEQALAFVARLRLMFDGCDPSDVYRAIDNYLSRYVDTPERTMRTANMDSLLIHTADARRALEAALAAPSLKRARNLIIDARVNVDLVEYILNDLKRLGIIDLNDEVSS